jgi:hypothetical protein
MITLPPSVYRLIENAERGFHALTRALQLLGALLGVTAGTVVALATAAVLRLSDPDFLRVMALLTAPGSRPPPVEGCRTMLLIVIFAGLIWAASGCRQTREWFNSRNDGSAL